ncbi:hypothetical protein CI109_106737 [Kwoniella shandongensis]|uniref:LYC1 C-terminal domain-containing protein n=1 Tax=Kwoniella shandongensis TaxID=1734106 RepID=A0A5M6C6S3_9TREE|nr:uncharacterized protein CI109_001007 [Kwoniella shandongensis]KAA5530827.1 hypothetical protein CI109_001007 [Kwoniella shandongensis]
MADSQLILIRCSDAQKTQTRKNHWSNWGAPLGFEEQGWVDRFTTMEQHEWAEEDRYVTWALVRKDDPESTDMLAHCETFKRKSIAKEPGSDQIKEVFSYGIASVFTPPSNRGKGYARTLLKLLHYVIAPPSLLPPFPNHWGTPPDIPGFKDAAFSVLYSGVGDRYYATCRRGDGESSEAGWIRHKVTLRTWKVPAIQGEESGQEGWEWLGPDSLGSLEASTEQEMIKGLDSRASDRYQFAILPSWSLFKVHAVRSEISPASKKYPGRPYGLVLPAVNGHDKDDRPFATWTFPEGEKADRSLEVTHVRHPVPFEAIQAAARKAGCVEISIWGETGDWDKYGPELDENEPVPCYVVYGHTPGVRGRRSM